METWNRGKNKRANRRKLKKKMSRMTIIGIAVLTLVLSGTMLFNHARLKSQCNQYNAQIQELKTEKKKLEEKKKEIAEFKDYVTTDEYAEEVARDKFGLVHKGEIVFEPEKSK